MTGITRKRPFFFLIIIGLLLYLCPGAEAALPDLTQEETAWLAAHDGTIRLAHTPDWPPLDFLNEKNEFSGMAADYIRLIEKKLGFKFKRVRMKSWSELIESAKAGTIDVISAGQETASRREFMNWSTPYLNLKTTIIVKRQLQGQLTLDQMQGMKIGVVSQYAVGEFIHQGYPDLTLINVDSSIQGIEKVSFGELDAMITEVPNALYIIESERITNLRLAGDTGFKLNHGMGIRKDWPVFSRIIEKALLSITDQEHKEIYRRWIKLETQNFYQTRAFWYSVLGITASVLLVIGTILLWNMELKKQVHQRTEALRHNEIGLEALLALNEKPHNSIQDIIEFSFQQMLELTQSRFGYLTLEDHDGAIYVVDSRESENQKELKTQVLPRGFDGHTKGFWGDAVDRGMPVISNNYQQSNPGLKGLPAAHKKILRYMNVPIFNHGRIVVVAGMGNKASDYTQADLRQLNLLAHGMWRLIQRKKAEQGMQKSEKRFEDLVENTPNGIAIVQNNIVVHKNSTQMKLMGDLNFLDPDAEPRFHQDDLPKVRFFFAQMVKDQLTQIELDFRFYPRSPRSVQDTLRWVTCIATPMDYRDQKAFLLIFIDTTEAKKLSHLLTVQDKMASLGNISAGIAHEIRNPLSGINIYLRTIEKYFRNPDQHKKIDLSIEAICSASQKIESVIKRVMNFAKPAEPRVNLIHVNDPIEEAIKLTRFTLNKEKINIIHSLDSALPDCYAEPHLIEEVVLNLINNAADAILKIRDQGTIKISSFSGTDTILFCVEDDGPGIDLDLRGKIFDPFFTTKANSTGIGLSLCRRIITDHKGILDVEQSDLGGACFWIELPLPDKTRPFKET
ncbi:AtoS3 [Desulforapulum autotrophicum HRM2]|uniref:histidine kinase n=1 Tax=Desulforapulum autotrophicum (strain ATCC 43914 / DSM 3382 / VKM B-1955 / HRM2) TaxID=177437 RepID=C0QC46_DESAH|nr:transporter substrate-binding domain-containing protein [Desulforapulum autotrophicum]ACN17063.1 AtoS3 [Desulforapulum autotrophicum HRM2]